MLQVIMADSRRLTFFVRKNETVIKPYKSSPGVLEPPSVVKYFPVNGENKYDVFCRGEHGMVAMLECFVAGNPSFETAMQVKGQGSVLNRLHPPPLKTICFGHLVGAHCTSHISSAGTGTVRCKARCKVRAQSEKNHCHSCWHQDEPES